MTGHHVPRDRMVKKGSARTPVEGACANGHVTKTEASRGRSTWQGTCPHDGCDLPVTARRVPYSPDGTATPATTTSETSSGLRVRRVRRWSDDPGFSDGHGEPGAGDPPREGGEGPQLQEGEGDLVLDALRAPPGASPDSDDGAPGPRTGPTAPFSKAEAKRSASRGARKGRRLVSGPEEELFEGIY